MSMCRIVSSAPTPRIRHAHSRRQPAGVAQSLRAPALHPSRPGENRRASTPVFHPLRARFSGQPVRRRHQLGNLHRHQFQKARRPDLRHQLRRGNEEIGLHHPQLPAARARRLSHALLRQHRRPQATSRSSSDSPEPAKPPSRRIPNAASSATTSTAGATTESSISRAAATPSAFASPARTNPRSGTPSASAPCSKTSPSIRKPACSTSTPMRSPKTPAPPIR